MRYFSLLLTANFIFSAAVQVNDPDPYLWIPIYLFAAVITWYGFLHKYNPYISAVAGIVYLAAGLYMLPPSVTEWIKAESEQEGWAMKTPMMEQARESFGLLICCFGMAFNLISFYVHRKFKIA